MTKRDETNLKKILSKFSTVDDFLDCLKQLEDYASNKYIDEGCYYIIDLNYYACFIAEHIKGNLYKVGFSYKNDWFNISFLQTTWTAPSQKFAELLVQEAKEIFKRLYTEVREEEQEFASKSNNKIKYVSKVPELKDIEGVELSEKQIQKAIEVFTKTKVEDEEFTKINDSFYIKHSSIIAIYDYPFGDKLTRIILEGGEKIDIHVWSQDVFKLLNKCKKDFIKIDDTYIKPDFVTTVFKSIRDDCTVIIALLKYGGEIIFPASRYTSDEIIEKLKKE